MDLILASQSPRRRELISLLGLPFQVVVPEADETMDKNADPKEQVALVSSRKAAAVARTGEEVVVAADTIVVCDGNILGKPRDEADAYGMLRLLSGRAHQVMTGLTVLYKDRQERFTEVTDVHFRELSDREIRRYIATGEPMDKAGAYGIQGGAALFVTHICGDYFNVVGLPVCRLSQMLRRIAPELMEEI